MSFFSTVSRVTVYVGVRAQISRTFIFSIILVNILHLFFLLPLKFLSRLLALISRSKVHLSWAKL